MRNVKVDGGVVAKDFKYSDTFGKAALPEWSYQAVLAWSYQTVLLL